MAEREHKKRTIAEPPDSKRTGEKMVYVSVPDYTSGKWAEMAHVDVAVIGDSLAMTDSHFKRTRPSVVEPGGRLKRRFSVATGCSTRLSWHFRAGADAKVAARRQVGGRQHEPTRRRTPTSGGGCGYQLRRWSNAKAGAGWSSGSAEELCAPPVAAHSGGPRAGAMRGGMVDSPRWSSSSSGVRHCGALAPGPGFGGSWTRSSGSSSRSRSKAKGGRAQSRSSRSRPARSAAA